jgi:uncharacterized protein YegJ (DUF2314 family)
MGLRDFFRRASEPRRFSGNFVFQFSLWSWRGVRQDVPVKYRLTVILIAFACVLTAGGCQNKEKEARRNELREIMHGNTPNADVAAAIARAKATVGDFLAVMQKPGAGQGDFLVRKAFPAGEGKQQILWINHLTYDGKMLHGRVDDNTAQQGSGLPPDGAVSFPPAEIADWMYRDGGKAVGGFMLRVLKEKFPEVWEAERYGEKIQFKE